MKIYYSKTNGTNDAINGSVLQEIIQKLGVSSDVKVMKYNAGETYTYDKLDSADIMIIGYNQDNIRADMMIIGKGVHDEIQRAFAKKIPVFIINTNDYEELHNPINNTNVGLEVVSDKHVLQYVQGDWKKFAAIHLAPEIDCEYDSNISFNIALSQSTKNWRHFIDTHNPCNPIDWKKYENNTIIPGEQMLSSHGNNKLLLLLCR